MADTEQSVGITINLPDGRPLRVLACGDLGGVPVLYFHGTPSSRLLAVSGHDAAVRQGVRLIAANRPGYGAAPDAPTSLLSVAKDMLALADALELNRFAVLGVSGGGPYALACGALAPERVVAVGVAAGIGPWRLVDPPGTNPEDRVALRLADAGDVEGALAAFKRLATQEYASMLRLDDDTMMDEFTRPVPEKERAVFTPHMRHLWAADMREALMSYDGYARDNLAWGGDWDLDLAALESPTWLWYGDEDRLVPADHGRWLHQRIASSTLVIRPGCGHGRAVFPFWDDMLTTLRRAVLAGV
ncbi:MAG TPA: alpha/beta hydrolase [Dermatophilaceae bacterium]|jgi:pimeloyl-ACP methyl ester carboxylesterase